MGTVGAPSNGTALSALLPRPALSRPAAAGGDRVTLSSTAQCAVASVAAPRGNPASAAFAPPPFTIAEVMNDPIKARAFMNDYLDREAGFFAVARNAHSGLSYDGVNLDPQTGQVASQRKLSAASKECLDVALLAKAVEGDERAARLVGGGDVATARKNAVEILAKKINSYEKWLKDWPGYGGYLPWYQQADDGSIQPTEDWLGAVPGLDNGEWAWALLTTESVLRKQGQTELADRYKAYNDTLIDNAAKIFWDPVAKKCRGDVEISDPKSANATYSTSDHRARWLTGEHGIHEGAMMVAYLALFGKGIRDEDVKQMYGDIHMKRVESPYGTTWQGFWGSSHESWAYMFMPLRELKPYQDLFRMREEIRTQNAATRGYPGLGASINSPYGDDYFSACGIEGIGTQPIQHNDVYTPYGAFPLLLECADRQTGNYGLAWLLNMCKGKDMYGPLGGSESGSNDGQHTAYIKTIDSSFTNLLAICGGLEKETARMLDERGVHGRFNSLMQHQYDEGFGLLPLYEPRGFALPTTSVPPAGARPQSVNACRAANS
jgi:hypothetical protein